MTSNNIEKKLSLFTLKSADNGLKDKILLRAGNAWLEKQKEPVFTFKLIRNYACALAMLFLIGITSSRIDNFLTDMLIDGKNISVVKTVEKTNDIEKLCSDLGFDCGNYKLLANMVRVENEKHRPANFDLRDHLMKEFNLTNGGLS